MGMVYETARKSKEASYFLFNKKASEKNQVLSDIADLLVQNCAEIIDANLKDCKSAKENGISDSLLDRLSLDEKRVEAMAESIREVIKLSDPIGETIAGSVLPNGLMLNCIRSPFGVIGIIYEARPNVTVDSAVLCLKAGSAVILRGSSHALNSNKKLVEVMQDALKKNNFPIDLIQLISSQSREDAEELMSLRQFVDVLIPRGGKGLIENVVKNSKVPVIETGIGNCHIYIDNVYSLGDDEITQIVINSKTQRPSVCNAAEKLLIHKDVPKQLVVKILDSLRDKKVKIKGCENILKIYPDAEPAAEDEWYEEFLDLVIAVKIVDSIEESVEHINKYSSHHSDAIITSSYENSRFFTSGVDSAAVYVNASTRFTDGGQFGMGAEIGISTQKLHWRGPMGLRQLVTNKFIVTGDGQIRE